MTLRDSFSPVITGKNPHVCQYTPLTRLWWNRHLHTLPKGIQITHPPEGMWWYLAQLKMHLPLLSHLGIHCKAALATHNRPGPGRVAGLRLLWSLSPTLVTELFSHWATTLVTELLLLWSLQYYSSSHWAITPVTELFIVTELLLSTAKGWHRAQQQGLCPHTATLPQWLITQLLFLKKGKQRSL